MHKIKFQKKSFAVFLFILFNVFFVHNVVAQGCCSATSLASGAQRSLLSQKSFAVSVGYELNQLNDALNNGKKITDPLKRSASVQMFTLEMEYGIAERISLLAFISHVSRQREMTVKDSDGIFNETLHFEGSGIGDATILAKYQLFSGLVDFPLEINIGGGIKLPTGSFTEEKTGARLAIDLQPGTGATDGLFWTYAAKHFPYIETSLFASGLYRYTGTNFTPYRLGDELNISVGGTTSISDFLITELILQSRFSGKDFSNGRLLTSTGGTTLGIQPAFTYNEGSVGVHSFVQFPLVRNLRGNQLAVSYQVGFSFAYKFNQN